METGLWKCVERKVFRFEFVKPLKVVWHLTHIRQKDENTQVFVFQQSHFVFWLVFLLQTAYRVLQQHPQILSSRIAMLGLSFGTTITFKMAVYSQVVKVRQLQLKLIFIFLVFVKWKCFWKYMYLLFYWVDEIHTSVTPVYSIKSSVFL